jgi:hypothetical protein
MGHSILPFVIFGIVLIVRMFAAVNKASGGSNTPPEESEEERMRRFREAVGLPSGGDIPPPIRPPIQSQAPPLQPINPPGRMIPPVRRPGQLQRVPPSQSAPAKPGTFRHRSNLPQRVPPLVAPASPAPSPATPSLFETQVFQPPVYQQPTIQAPQEFQRPVLQAPADPPPTPAPAALFAPAATAGAADQSTAVPPQAGSLLLQRLRNPSAIREAIVMREILGPPKALQSGTAGVTGLPF